MAMAHVGDEPYGWTYSPSSWFGLKVVSGCLALSLVFIN